MTKKDHQIIATWVFGSLSFIFLICVFIFAPNELPPFKHKLLSLFSALLAGLFAYFLTGSFGLSGKSGLSFLGELGIRATGGVAIFIFVLLWWNSELSPVKVQHKNAIIPFLTNEDVHLGDNVYPNQWGYSHNPLYMAIYPQSVKGLIYFNKETEKFLAGTGNQTLIGQFFVNYYNKLIRGLDFSGYKFVSSYYGNKPYPAELNNYLSDNNADHYVSLGPTFLYTNSDNKGNFYEPFAAVSVVSAVDFTIPLAKADIVFEKKNIHKVELFVECYHGGIRPGQSNNFAVLINNHIRELETKSQNMREKEVICIDIPIDDPKFKEENIVGIFVLPWQEDRPKSFETNKGPIHFRDVGIVNVYFKVTAI